MVSQNKTIVGTVRRDGMVSVKKCRGKQFADRERIFNNPTIIKEMEVVDEGNNYVFPNTKARKFSKGCAAGGFPIKWKRKNNNGKVDEITTDDVMKHKTSEPQMDFPEDKFIEALKE